MRNPTRIMSFVLAVGLVACSDLPTSTSSLSPVEPRMARPTKGTGIAITDFATVPVIGDIEVQQVVITGLSTFLGGVQASGTITGTTVDALGNTITVTNDFTGDVLVSSSGPGQCRVVTVDLSGIDIDALGIVNADLPVATVNVSGSGAVGPLLCALGSVVNGVAGGVVGGLVNALNGLLGGSLPAPVALPAAYTR
jgi:hypothetical protein